MYILYTTTIKGFRFISAEILGSVKNQGKLRELAKKRVKDHKRDPNFQSFDVKYPNPKSCFPLHIRTHLLLNRP